MKITIREYRQSDFEACRSLWVELIRYHRDIYDDPTIGDDAPEQSFQPSLDNPNRKGTWVAEVEGNVAGYAGLLIFSPKEGEVEPVIVTASCRSRGIGSMLVEKVVEEATKAGVRFLSIRPVGRNTGALSLYVRLGFSALGSVELVQDLSGKYDNTWKSGIEIHGNNLRY